MRVGSVGDCGDLVSEAWTAIWPFFPIGHTHTHTCMPPPLTCWYIGSVLAQNNLNNNDMELVMETSQVSWQMYGLGIGHQRSVSFGPTIAVSFVRGNPFSTLVAMAPVRPENLLQLQITGACNCWLLCCCCLFEMQISSACCGAFISLHINSTLTSLDI